MSLPSKVTRPAIILLVALGIYLWEKTHGDRIPWRTDYAAAQAESHQTGKPLLLYFEASWCGPCQAMKSETWSSSAVAAELTQYVPVKIDIDVPGNKPLALEYHADAQGIPLFVVLDNHGNLVRTGAGSMYANEFLSWLSGQTP